MSHFLSRVKGLIARRCFERGLGAHVWDPEGNEYLDFLAAYS